MKGADLKKGMDARFDVVDARFDAVDARLEQHEERLKEHDARFDQLEARIIDSQETTRRHFDIVAEQLRADMKLLYDGVIAMNDQISGFMRTNAREHAAILQALDNHEVRIKSLESNSRST